MAACVRIRVLGLVALVGCGDRYGRILELEGDRLQGEILYSQDCASCHSSGSSGRNTRSAPIPASRRSIVIRWYPTDDIAARYGDG